MIALVRLLRKLGLDRALIVARSAARLTCDSITPGTFFILDSTCATHEAQLIPSILISNVSTTGS